MLGVLCRLAPLSEGRIDEKGTLMCSYHGERLFFHTPQYLWAERSAASQPSWLGVLGYCSAGTGAAADQWVYAGRTSSNDEGSVVQALSHGLGACDFMAWIGSSCVTVATVTCSMAGIRLAVGQLPCHSVTVPEEREKEHMDPVTNFLQIGILPPLHALLCTVTVACMLLVSSRTQDSMQVPNLLLTCKRMLEAAFLQVHSSYKHGAVLLACNAGWEFNGQGACTRIPQIGDRKAEATACSSGRSCVASYPVKVCVSGIAMSSGLCLCRHSVGHVYRHHDRESVDVAWVMLRLGVAAEPALSACFRAVISLHSDAWHCCSRLWQF